MAFLVKKTIKGKIYLYLRHNHRVNGKVKTAWQVYLGPEEEFATRTKIAKQEITTETLEFGLIAALKQIADQINLVDVIDKETNKRNQGVSVGEHILIAALNRCIQPTTKKQLQSWVKTTVIPKLFPNLTPNLDSRAYWNHFGYLSDESIEKIENKLIRNIQNEFNINLSEISFDPTNFYTYINPKKDNQTLARHGHSKEGKRTLNIVNLSLFCTLDGGIPLFHLLYPGKIHDATHFKSALPALQRRLSALKLDNSTITLTFDKGNLSKEAFQQIDDLGLNFICSDRPSTHKNHLSIHPDKFAMHTLPNGKEIGTLEIHDDKYGKVRRFIATYNPRKAKWSINNMLEKIDKKKGEIETYFKERLTFIAGKSKKEQGSKWRIRDEVETKIQSMIGKGDYRKILMYELTGPDEIPISEAGQFHLKLIIDSSALDTAKLKMGKSFLMTNRMDLTPFDIVQAYRQQYLVEQAFKWLKSVDFLQIRPMFHHVNSSVRGHVFVCYLGLLLLSLLVHKLINLGIPSSIYETIDLLSEMKITRIHLTGRRDPIENLNQLSPKADTLLNVLKLSQML